MRRKSAFTLGSGLALTAILAAATIGAASPAFAACSTASGTTSTNGHTSRCVSPATADALATLGKASTYSALAGAAITAPASTIQYGNVGAAAALTTDASSVIPSSEIQGTDPTTAALNDLTTAFAALNGLTAKPLPGAADLGGQTFTPGVYHSDAALTDSGILTFDAQGDSSAVFIILTDAAINSTAGTQMILARNAQASNIYWVSAAATTIGAGSVFDGTIISQAAITVGAGTTINGRALSVTAAITMDNNVIDSRASAGQNATSRSDVQ